MKGSTRNKTYKDHLGRKFNSIKAMCAAWGIEPETFARRRKVYHMTLEEALTRPVKNNGGLVCFDHNGVRYRSRSYMCKHWKVDRKLFEYRISHGWTLEEALTKTPHPAENAHKKSPSTGNKGMSIGR